MISILLTNRNRVRIPYTLALFSIIVLSCGRYPQDKTLFYSVSCDNPQSRMNGYMMDYIKIDSPEKRRVSTLFIRMHCDNDSFSLDSIDYIQYKEVVLTNDSMYVGYSEKKPQMTITTNQPLIYSSPVNPSYFQYVKDSIICVAGKEYAAHFFITKPYYYKNDTLFVGTDSYDYFCDSDFQLIYTNEPYPIILFDYGNGIPCGEDIVRYIRIDEHLIPHRIVKVLKKKGKENKSVMR